MEPEKLLDSISRGRTDYLINLMRLENWREILNRGRIKPLQWLVYYNDTTGLRAVMEAGGTLDSINLNDELGNAAFFGHWKVCDFLINQGADPTTKSNGTHETPLHNALVKAGRPYYFYTVRLLIEKGAEVNARTIPGHDTGAFMRDVRTRGETPLHRAAAFADERTIGYLLDHGADREAKDANGDTPLSWASMHLRPGNILYLLQYGEHKVSEKHKEVNISDHGCGWGNGMDWNLIGDYLPE